MDIAISPQTFLNDLLVIGKKPTEQQILLFYRNFQHGHDVLIPYSKFIEDSFHVDLTALSDEELLLLHQYTKWISPSYFLRKRHVENLEHASDEILLCLVQGHSHAAYETWYGRYQSKIEKAPDELLVLMHKNGNQDALNILTKRHKNFIKNLIRQLKQKGRFFRGMDDDDVFQESMSGYLKAIKDYKIERKMKFTVFTRFVIEKYLDTIINQSKNTKNSSLNDSYSFHAPIRNDAEMTFEESFESERTPPDELAVKKDTFYAIWETLTPLEKKVLLFYTEGHSYEEIGQIIGKDKKAVDNTIQRIRTKGTRYEEMFFDL